ncbi:MAG TPA: GyrI-like domain-containing protein [Candidatus Dormibacteraeota bacterium]|nr:GyrI-like domain-containing protein [Candidatus Dormibacteraeota bacterium]
MSTAVAAIKVKELYAPSAKEPSIVDVPEMQFLMVDGTGDPNQPGPFQEAIQALYSLSYGAKFMLKKEGIEFRVSPLEGLWGSPGGLNPNKKMSWQWTALVMQPAAVTSSVLQKVRAEAMRKKPLAALSRVRLETFREGRSAQIMHIGPYSSEAPTIAKLHEFIKKRGYHLVGKHHEIYLGDPRRSAPERLKTLIRQPIQ